MVPSYKRLTLMLNDPAMLSQLLNDPDQPLQIVVAGKAHPADEGGKGLIQQMVQFSDSADVRRRIVFLPDYDMAMAHALVQGCDVWLNNPLRPLEACGTSGMKAALNGGLNVSVRDGWWDEWYDGGNGWEIPSADGVTDTARRDALGATALYEPPFAALTAESARAASAMARFSGEVPLDQPGPFGYTVRILPNHPLLDSRRTQPGDVPAGADGMTNGDLR